MFWHKPAKDIDPIYHQERHNLIDKDGHNLIDKDEI
jgi:hypothetical protein